jgi:DNA-binding HxlR family transcriptional regulator
MYNEVPPRVVYRLTRYGRTALPIVRRLSGWGRRHAERVCAQQGSELRVVKVVCGPRPNESTIAAV